MPKKRHLPNNIEIIYEDDDILVADKPAGLLTVATDNNETRTAYYILTDYVRKGNPKSRNRLFIVHRLDRFTSGLIVFAKNPQAKLYLQSHWPDTQKTYLAVVYGRLNKKQDTITSYLAETRAFVVYSTKDKKKGKLAKTAYKVLRETEQFTMLEINLLTGRKNQIRVHFADINHPVVGDRKYGKPRDPFRRLALHARTLSFNHPVTNQPMSFDSKTPSYFTNLLAAAFNPK